jgi:hypothetical protein
VKVDSLAPGEAVSLEFSLEPSEQIWRPYRSFLEVITDAGGGATRHRAGLLMTTPFAAWAVDGAAGENEPVRPADAKLFESVEHEFLLEGHGRVDQTLVFETTLKNPWQGTPRFMGQSNRPVKIWLDGKKILDHQGGYTFNAIHIAKETGADAEINRGAYRLTFAVGPGHDADPGHLFWAIGFADSWRWLEEAEFRNPFLPPVSGASTADGA